MSAGDELRRIARRAGTVGGRAAATALADAGQKEIRQQLTKRSHPPRTPTPAPPGQPPAKISGHLAGSVVTVRAVQVGAHKWSSAAGPTAVYARIQNLGGRTGYKHMTTLPPRPYMPPAARAMSVRAGDIAQGAFYRAVFG